MAEEQKTLPRFRQNLYFSGYGEGWGLYCEWLGIEMGIYRTPYEKFGQQSYAMWRAARLVIDTGIHRYGWSRAQAIDTLHRALAELEIAGVKTNRALLQSVPAMLCSTSFSCAAAWKTCTLIPSTRPALTSK